MALCHINPVLSIFSQALPIFATHIFFTTYSFHANMLILCITLGKKIALSVCQKCSVTQKYAQNAFSIEAPPLTALGKLTTLPRPPSRLGSGHLRRSPLVPPPKPSAPCCFRASYSPARARTGAGSCPHKLVSSPKSVPYRGPHTSDHDPRSRVSVGLTSRNVV